MTVILQGLVLSAVSYITWRLIRPFFVKTSLDNIRGPPSHAFLTGNMLQIFSTDGWGFLDHISETYGAVVKLHGLFGERQLYISDPKALHHIVVKDQDIYEETPAFLLTNRIVFGTSLISTTGEHHKRQRKILNPVFSPTHMRNLMPIFFDVSYQLRKVLSEQLAEGPREVDMLDWLYRTSLELIGQSGLGYSFNALTERSYNSYANALKNLVPSVFRLEPFRQFVPFLIKLGSPAFRRLLVDLTPSPALHETRDITDTMDRTAKEILAAKKRALSEGEEAASQQIGRGKDIISVLLKANSEASEEDRLPESEVLAQMSALLFAATDTTSGVLARILHRLSEYPEIQDKVRSELKAAWTQNDADIPQDELNALPYLDAICKETLRLHPPLMMIGRMARKDAVLPLSTPLKGVDGSDIHEIPIPNNTNILVSILAVNRDPSIWGKDAAEWKPERWLSPLPQSVTDARIPGIYSNMMTFLGGGRACIGVKFSQLEMKTVLAVLLHSFSFSLPNKEIFWNMGILQTPCVKGTEGIQMPLVVNAL